MAIFDLLELEEQVGRAWHRLAGRPTSLVHFPEAAVDLVEVRGALGVFFRALGGDRAVRVVESSVSRSDHRLSWRQRLAMSEEKLPIARRDEEALRLPARLDCFPDRALNRDLYWWLAAFLGDSGWDCNEPPADALQADVLFLHNAAGAAERTCRRYPGLRRVYRRLCEEALATRPARLLPGYEAAVEAALVRLLGVPDPTGASGDLVLRSMRAGRRGLAALHAPIGYRRLLMPPVWGIVEAAGRGSPRPDDDAELAPPAAGDGREGSPFTARREDNEQSERDDPLILNRFEKILGWSEMVDVNRPTEDEDETAARRAADDHDYLSLGSRQRKPATRLKLELELAPTAVDGDVLEGGATYPEWDFRRACYHPRFCRVVECAAAIEGEGWRPDETTRRRIRHVRRQFEALRPRRQRQHRQIDGCELDTDAAVRARSELAATGAGSEQIFEAHRSTERDLAVAVLTDVSLSTDAWVDNRRVLDVEKEAMLVLAHGLAGCGDAYALYTFTSRRRDAVRIETIKTFEERLGDVVERRISALHPGAYTRIGAALRHVARRLRDRPEAYRLILLLTDGKPNDMDHYEGRYGVEDTRMAVREARRSGLGVFVIAIDKKARDYVPYLFGRGGYAIISHVARLPSALPLLYRHVTE
ncbi:MAG: nitric oxide reductase activation protein NorD [Bacteroidota bacterium]